MVDEVPMHPFVVDPRSRDGRIDGVLDLASERARGADRRRLLRWVEHGEREQSEVDADGCEQRDEIATGDRLSAIGVADRLTSPREHGRKAEQIGRELVFPLRFRSAMG